MEEWMTVNEYAEHLKTYPQAVRNMCGHKFIPCVKIGVGWRIPVSQADEALLKGGSYSRVQMTDISDVPKHSHKKVKATPKQDVLADMKQEVLSSISRIK